MYSVIKVGSSQYKVSEGDIIQTDRLKSDPGQEIKIDKVLLFVNDSDVRIGRPLLDVVDVTAKVVKHSLGPKVINFRYRRRKDSTRKVGHRKQLTELNITKISV